MVARDENPVGGCHIVEAPARLRGLLRLAVEHDLPIRIAQEEIRDVADVALEEELCRTRGDDESAVAGRVTAGVERGDAGGDLLAPFVSRHLVGKVGENLAIESERRLLEAFRR